MLTTLYKNHVLANLCFVLILGIGMMSYSMLPRQQDPTINFNWIDITTVVPGASAEDIEKRVTDLLEDAIYNVADIKFVSSNSREGISSLLVRFEDVDERIFDKRVNDLRREIQNKEDELPEEAVTPVITEITSANAYPTATVVITSPGNDENLRRQAENAKRDIQRIKGVDRLINAGLNDPEIQINFYPERLEELGLSPNLIADGIQQYFRDISAGSIKMQTRRWNLRLQGTSMDVDYLASLPILTEQGEVTLGSIADVVLSQEKARISVRYRGKPAVMFSVMKKAKANTIGLVERINDYIDERNQYQVKTGVQLVLIDDSTEITRNALSVMQKNAALGLLFVLLVTWVFLGSRISILTTIGIPFILAGTFCILIIAGQTLNVLVLLGVVISLGMLVDDTVVVVEAIYYRMQRGAEVMPATLAALKEVFAPVTSAVLTTMAAFLPLMLLPGILGKYMMTVPLVVSVALAISLVEAYWMLPAHISASNLHFDKPSKMDKWRRNFLHIIRLRYTRLLLRVMRYPRITLMSMVVLFVISTSTIFMGMVKVDFFASDPMRVFYINIEMPNGTSLEKTLSTVTTLREQIAPLLLQDELKQTVSYAGQMFTETAPRRGEHYGQIFVSLNPRADNLRSVEGVIEALRDTVFNLPGPSKVNFLKLAGGPPVSRPINIKVRGDKIAELREAVTDLTQILQRNDAIMDIGDDDSPGQMELLLKVNHDAALRAGIGPIEIARTLRLLVDGEVAASMHENGKELVVRVQANRHRPLDNIYDVLNFTLPATDGKLIALSELLHVESRAGLGNVRHYNFRRAITVEADIDKSKTDTVAINAYIKKEWDKIQGNYPNVSLDYSGALDDIQESMDSIAVLFLFGIGLMYLILGTQFKSYFQPFMVLTTVPIAFTGVVLGLLVTQNPLSLYTLYGVVALAGISVNAAIVLISAANDRMKAGMSVLHATVYAARRRVVPILITSLTTIAGLFSLATGLGGHSLIWGPVATAMVWGLLVSTCLTLFVVPILYRLSMRHRA
ncbi:RND multidrug efflux transporter; Acriflavin resistance protein [hydrothermal vent metagenome]|uniref:RND multidrug efflux transporter Acriflavin resistance protein n=1 Tax=hydrothermal vent metagenome TaxID=652676 RepID=A0A3B1BGU7_9ZZZZ